MNPIEMQAFINHLHWQAQKLIQMEKLLQALQDEIKQQQTPKIDKMEYNFDQLKIEKLEGTLNIGISPNQGKSIEDFTVNGQSIDQASQTSMQESPFYARIHKNINDFIETDVPFEIQRLSDEYRVHMPYEKHSLIMDDLRKQIDERIQYYVSEETIADKVKKDILNGVNQYLSKISEGEREA